MQVPPDELTEAPSCLRPDSAKAEEQSGNPCRSTTADLIYDLRVNGANSDRFYEDCAHFSDKVLAEIELRASSLLDAYIEHFHESPCEAGRSRGEYAVDLLTLGLFVRRYSGAAESTPVWVVALARELYWLRRESAWLKPVTDFMRGAINRLFLAPKTDRKTKAESISIDQVPRLIDWLLATGEFEQEVKRLSKWRSYLSNLPETEANHWLEVSVEIFDWFEYEADLSLGGYTQGVEEFLAAEYAHRGVREDQIFCGKQPAEYHLAMVAAEIMNRGLRERFEQMPRKAVLVPGCMRGTRADSCRAHVSGTDITCAGCDSACAVNRITTRLRSAGVQVYLVPHSTGFSRWLQRWQREPDMGVVAVACLLNILPGGYEMRARRIASQCVPLDFPGCEKHWRSKGISTEVNEDRLVKIVDCPPQ